MRQDPAKTALYRDKNRERLRAVWREQKKKKGLLYHTWLNMRNRCNNPNSEVYKYYGARGISVCARWDSFEAFESDMGPRPAGMTLDRIDTNGDYAPDNCRWSTLVEQAQNKRNSWRNPHVTQWICYMRTELGWTGKEIAAFFGRSPSAVSLALRGAGIKRVSMKEAA